MIATGVKSKKQAGSEIVPVKAITSVNTKRDGFVNTIVHVTVPGNKFGFRVGHDLAKKVEALLTQLMLGIHPSQAALAPTAQIPAARVPDLADQLSKLARLRDQGILTQDEFNAKKTQLLDL
jgi:hypothetical protein